jgi:hypothetical protein
MLLCTRKAVGNDLETEFAKLMKYGPSRSTITQVMCRRMFAALSKIVPKI